MEQESDFVSQIADQMSKGFVIPLLSAPGGVWPAQQSELDVRLSVVREAFLA